VDTSDVYPDVLGDAFSSSSQRLAQLGSLVTAAATMEVRRRAQDNAVNATRSRRALRALHEQQRAERLSARAGWAPAHDAKWLGQADLLQAARVWSAAAAYADADPAAASALRKCEERLRVLHPYAMAWYDRRRGEGAGAVEAMRETVPLFGRAPHARPGEPGAERRGLTAPDGLEDASRDAGASSVREPGRGSGAERQVELRGRRIVQKLQIRAMAERGYALSPDELGTTLGATTTLPGDVIARLAHGHGEDRLAAGAAGGRADGFSSDSSGGSPGEGDVHSERLAVVDAARMNADKPSAQVRGDRTAAQLAAESFPGTAADAIMAATNSEMRSGQSGNFPDGKGRPRLGPVPGPHLGRDQQAHRPDRPRPAQGHRHPRRAHRHRRPPRRPGQPGHCQRNHRRPG